MTTLLTARPDDKIEIALTTCLAEIKSALDGHCAVYDREQHVDHASTAKVSFDEETSISATARLVLEWCCQTLETLNQLGFPRSMWRDKHGLCGDMIFTMVKRLHENNVVAQRPGYDVVQFGLDLVQFIQSYYVVLADRSMPHERTAAYKQYMQMPHKVRHDMTVNDSTPVLHLNGKAFRV